MKTLLVLLLGALIAPAYADDPPPVFVDSAVQTAPPPPADKAQIIVFEPINKIQGLFPVGIYEIKGEEHPLVGIGSWRSRSIINLDPGKHLLFASQGFGGHILEANVEAGRRYYVLLRFIYAQGMQLRPIRTSGTTDYRTSIPEFAEWNSNRFIEKTPAADDMFKAKEKQIKNFDKGLAKALENWQAKTDAERAELTLTAADAVPL